MSILIKDASAIEKMRVAGRLAGEVLQMIRPHVKAGITTDELDKICHEYIVDVQDAIPAPLNYHGFPKSICTSVGYHGDTSKMFFVGEPPIRARRVSQIAHECMKLGIEQVKPGAHLGDIGHVIQQHAESNNFSVVREYCGHGIGLGFHEDPQVLHYGKASTGVVLEPGMIFTIEPMINAGKRHVKLLNDNWTVVTKDHSASAQWEHTILVTGDGHDILTQCEGDEI
jgi:methionyl aminopeptidase